MIARGFKPVAWVAAIGVAALSCYMLSLRVAAERADVASLDREILTARQAIRSLQTELGTRGRLQQLESWNAEVLALSAPVAGQFLESNVSLARFDVRQRTFEDQAEVRVAAAPAPAPTPTLNAPRVTMASATASPPAAAKPAVAPRVVQASLQTPDRGAQRASQATQLVAERPASSTRPAGAPPRTPSLLGDNVLRELRTEARAERGGGTRN